MDKEQCLQLIQLYSQSRNLWDARCRDYNNRGLREEAWKNIHRITNIPIFELKKKMESLLGSYRREKSRERSQVRSTGRGESYKSNWYAYEAFYFLEDRNYPNKQDIFNKENTSQGVVQNDDNQNALDNEETVETRNEDIDLIRDAEEPQEQSSRAKKRAKKRAKRATYDVPDNGVPKELNLQNASNSVGKADSYDVFGQYIANELRKYDAFTLAHAKRAISEVIFEADTGAYQPGSAPTYNRTASPNYASRPSTSSIPPVSPILPVSPMMSNYEMESSHLVSVKLSPPQLGD